MESPVQDHKEFRNSTPRKLSSWPKLPASKPDQLTGAYPALHEAIRVAGAGGTVIAAGFYQGPAAALALGEEFHQVTLVSSQIGSVPPSLRDRWTRERLHETVIRLYAAGRLDPMPLVSHVIPARSAADAYRLVDSPPPDLVQVMLSFVDSQREGQVAA
jgi:threonine dehydrogenase-like Zn-dependent dehydrogenase